MTAGKVSTKSEFSSFGRKGTALLRSLSTPRAIQNFLDKIQYRAESVYCCPLDVIRDRRANCFDGALFAAAALKFHGYPALIWDLRAVNDDDHVLALVKLGKFWGAIGKSNFVGLRYRDPVYRSLRELAMSYFESYYNTRGQKTLRAFSMPLKLARFDRRNWLSSRESLSDLAALLDDILHFDLLTAKGKNCIARVDKRSFKAGLFGAVTKGLYKP